MVPIRTMATAVLGDITALNVTTSLKDLCTRFAESTVNGMMAR
jgi:hypothetical protein